MDDVYSLSEEDIKLRYITPAILNKEWSVEDITMETQVKLTDGKINLRGNLVARGKAKLLTTCSTTTVLHLLLSSRQKTLIIVSAMACSKPRNMQR